MLRVKPVWWELDMEEIYWCGDVQAQFQQCPISWAPTGPSRRFHHLCSTYSCFLSSLPFLIFTTNRGRPSRWNFAQNDDAYALCRSGARHNCKEVLSATYSCMADIPIDKFALHPQLFAWRIWPSNISFKHQGTTRWCWHTQPALQNTCRRGILWLARDKHIHAPRRPKSECSYRSAGTE